MAAVVPDLISYLKLFKGRENLFQLALYKSWDSLSLAKSRPCDHLRTNGHGDKTYEV